MPAGLITIVTADRQTVGNMPVHLQKQLPWVHPLPLLPHHLAQN